MIPTSSDRGQSLVPLVRPRHASSRTTWGLLLALAACVPTTVLSSPAFGGIEAGESAEHVSGDPAPNRQDSPATVPAVSDAAARAEIEALKKEVQGIAAGLVESFPDSPEALRVLGAVHNTFDETAKAAECWEKALQLNPVRSDLYTALALLAQSKGEYEKAAEICRTGLGKAAPTPGLYHNLAAALIGLGKPEEAIPFLQRAVEVWPKDGEGHHLMGKTYSLLNQHEKAKASYQEAVRLQPRNTSSHYGLAMACAKLGLDDQSKRSMDQYQKLAAENMAVQRSMRGAVHDLRRQSQILASTCAESAMVYVANRQLAKAEELLRRGSHVAPTDTACRVKLAVILANTQRAQEAISVCRELIAIEPKNSAHYLALAGIYARLRRFDDARLAAREALDLDPDNEACRRMLQQLQGRR